ncbi:acylneuraminate cytidylyltransferase family protein [Chitinophaga caseinilytica]|uniref:acylneuraminate cytidylyltransferase family protein n=1 Tax=Chitinophaga caseinilytica TaxID=2267521 RepID=UPI003C2E0E74
MSLLITLCARGGSKGIPGKNIKPLAGRPLIDYSLSVARAVARELSGQVALSTDDEQIRAVARELGLPSDYQRPAELASDTAGKVDAIRDLLFFHEKQAGQQFDLVLDLDITSPLRTVDDILAAYRTFEANPEALTLFSVNNANRNPYFNMVEQQQNGFYYFVKTNDGAPLSRQAAPRVYELNASFYFYRRSFFDLGLNRAITDKSLIYEMPHICFDLDHPIDFDFLEFLILQSKLEFDLI